MGDLMKTRLVVGALTFFGVSAACLPASASTLALDFAPTPSSYTSHVVSDEFVQTSAVGWQFTLTSSVTITGLAGFDGGSSANIANGTGDTIKIYNGTIGTNASLNDTAIKNALIASALVGGSTGGTQDNAWLYNTSMTTANGNTLTLGPGSYFIIDLYSGVNSPNNIAGAPNDNTGKVTDVNQLISTIAGLTWTSEVVCDNNSQCTEPVPAPVGGVQGYGLFGPTFLVDDAGVNLLGATPLPGAVWLMGGVLAGATGIARWRSKKQKLVTA
jgi:hypothetical protein